MGLLYNKDPEQSTRSWECLTSEWKSKTKKEYPGFSVLFSNELIFFWLLSSKHLWHNKYLFCTLNVSASTYWLCPSQCVPYSILRETNFHYSPIWSDTNVFLPPYVFSYIVHISVCIYTVKPTTILSSHALQSVFVFFEAILEINGVWDFLSAKNTLVTGSSIKYNVYLSTVYFYFQFTRSATNKYTSSSCVYFFYKAIDTWNRVLP